MAIYAMRQLKTAIISVVIVAIVGINQNPMWPILSTRFPNDIFGGLANTVYVRMNVSSLHKKT
jgi:hypothetical protein